MGRFWHRVCLIIKPERWNDYELKAIEKRCCGDGSDVRPHLRQWNDSEHHGTGSGQASRQELESRS